MPQGERVGALAQAHQMAHEAATEHAEVATAQIGRRDAYRQKRHGRKPEYLGAHEEGGEGTATGRREEGGHAHRRQKRRRRAREAARARIRATRRW